MVFDLYSLRKIHLAKPGATVLIVFQLLDSRKLVQNWFTADQVFRFYQDEMVTSAGKERVYKLLDNFKKRKDKGPLWAFEKSTNIGNWLKLHFNGKPRYGFEFDGQRFRFKDQYIGELRCWLEGY